MAVAWQGWLPNGYQECVTNEWSVGPMNTRMDAQQPALLSFNTGHYIRQTVSQYK